MSGAARRPMVPIDDIVRGLTDRLEQLCTALLPAARRAGPLLEVGSLQGEPGKSLKIKLTGARRGNWKDYSTEQRGDALELVAAVACGGNKTEAIRWARQWLGFDAMPPGQWEKQRAELAARAEVAVKQAQVDDEKTQARCMRDWLNAEGSLAGSPVDLYLAGRGIRLSQLRRPPGALRFHPSLWNPETNREWPAMLGCIYRLDTPKLVGLHRTWLQVRGDGSVSKAPLKDAKMSLGHVQGGFVALSRGRTGLSLPKAPDGEVVALSEGIEDGLSIALAFPDMRVLCAISLGNMINLTFPSNVAEVAIVGQNDKPTSAAANTLDRVVERFRKSGKRVRVMRPPPGYKDFNDMLRGIKIKPENEQ